MNNKEKDRDLSVLELFEKLQEEYYINQIRKKIYPVLKDKRYYERVMGHKEEKIRDISDKNKLDSIFTSSEVEKEFRNKVYPDMGPPTFRGSNVTDVENYYMMNSDVRVTIDGENKIGKIDHCDLDNNIVYVKLRGEETSKPFIYKFVTRIL